MPDVVQLGGWVVAILVALISLIAALMPKKGSLEHQMIDQLQEQIAANDKKLQEQITVTDSKVDASLRRERIRDDYIHELRDHIDQRKPPPPPPWPEGLTR